MTRERMLHRLTALAIAAVYRLMQRAPVTRYRQQVTDEIEKLLEDLDRARGVTPRMPRRTRALLLTVKRVPDAGADLGAVIGYVRAVVLGVDGDELAARVQATGCPELMGRFVRYARGVDRADVKKMWAVAEVMGS